MTMDPPTEYMHDVVVTAWMHEVWHIKHNAANPNANLNPNPDLNMLKFGNKTH